LPTLAGVSDFPISDEAGLAEYLSTATDAEVNALAETVGVDEILDRVFAQMRERFQPDKVIGVDAVVRFDLRTPQGDRTFHLVAREGTLSVGPGLPADPPRVMLGLNFPDFLRLITGQLDGMQAFMSGRLRLSGDMLLAQNVEEWFG
jgi:putative sterol carrier protein